MKSLNEYIKKRVEQYTFEDYCTDNHILYEEINDNIHKNFVIENWNPVLHREYFRYKSNVYESILKSYDNKKLYNEILNNFDKDIVPYNYTYNDRATVKSFVIKYKKTYTFTETEKFRQLLNLYNYFITYIDKENKLIHLEPNIPDNMTDYVYNDCNGIVYHITKTDIYETKIKKYGLKPKTASYRKFPECVFVTTGKNEQEIKENIKYVKDILTDDPPYFRNTCILKIDLNKYKNKITLYKDNGMENNSFWTSEYIPPYCIKTINI